MKRGKVRRVRSVKMQWNIIIVSRHSNPFAVWADDKNRFRMIFWAVRCWDCLARDVTRTLFYLFNLRRFIVNISWRNLIKLSNQRLAEVINRAGVESEWCMWHFISDKRALGPWLKRRSKKLQCDAVMTSNVKNYKSLAIVNWVHIHTRSATTLHQLLRLQTTLHLHTRRISHGNKEIL